MAKKNQNITTAQTLNIMVEIMSELPDNEQTKALKAKVAKLAANAAKVAKRPKVETPTQRQNKQNAAKVLAYLKDHNEPLTLKDIQNVGDYITSTQKAVAIVNILTAQGVIKKAEEKKDGHIAYILA